MFFHSTNGFVFCPHGPLYLHNCFSIKKKKIITTKIWFWSTFFTPSPPSLEVLAPQLCCRRIWALYAYYYVQYHVWSRNTRSAIIIILWAAASHRTAQINNETKWWWRVLVVMKSGCTYYTIFAADLVFPPTLNTVLIMYYKSNTVLRSCVLFCFSISHHQIFKSTYTSGWIITKPHKLPSALAHIFHGMTFLPSPIRLKNGGWLLLYYRVYCT